MRKFIVFVILAGVASFFILANQPAAVPTVPLDPTQARATAQVAQVAVDIAAAQRATAEYNLAVIQGTQTAEARRLSAEAAQATVQAKETAIQATAQSQHAAATATRQADLEAQATAGLVMAWTATAASDKSTATAAASDRGTAQAVKATASSASITSTADALRSSLQIAAVQAQSTQVALAVERDEFTNHVKAASPWVAAAMLVGLLVPLGWRIGGAVVGQQKVVRDAAGDPAFIADQTGPRLNVIDTSRLAYGIASSSSAGVQAPVLSEEYQLRLNAMSLLGRLTAPTAVNDELSIKPVAPVALIPSRAEWSDMQKRRYGQMLLGVGTDEVGQVIARMDTPHILLAGQTGSGKSTEMRTIIAQHLLDGRRVTILDKSGRDFEVFDGLAHIERLDATNPEAAIARLIGVMRAAWNEVLHRQRGGRWKGMTDVLVIDELDNWQDVSADASLTARRLWQYPRMIAREGRASGFCLLAASQNPTAANISLDLRRNCTPVAFRLADSAASRVVIDGDEAVGLETGQFVALLGKPTRGVAYNPTDNDLGSVLAHCKPAGVPDWLLDPVDVDKTASETWQATAARLYTEGKSISWIASHVRHNYYDTQAAIKAASVPTTTGSRRENEGEK